MRKIVILFSLLCFSPFCFSIPSWPKHEFKANIKISSVTSEDGSNTQKVTISLIQDAYRLNRRRVNKKSNKAWFYCRNAPKGCTASCVANINGDQSIPASYSIENMNNEHCCMDTVTDLSLIHI